MCRRLQRVLGLPSHHHIVTNREGLLRFRPFPASHEAVPLLLPLLRDGQIAHGQGHHPFECLSAAVEEDLHLLVCRFCVQLLHVMVS